MEGGGNEEATTTTTNGHHERSWHQEPSDPAGAEETTLASIETAGASGVRPDLTNNDNDAGEDVEASGANDSANGNGGAKSSNGLSRSWTAPAALCLVSLSNAYVIMSVFSYSGYMVVWLSSAYSNSNPNSSSTQQEPSSNLLNTENAGKVAGLLASCFMFGRFFTVYQWGRLADSYGRKPALAAALLCTAIFSLAFGLSRNLWLALLARALTGMSNGLVSTNKTLANELANGNRNLETRYMGLVVGMRSWAMLLSPAVGGFLSEPLAQYPALNDHYRDLLLLSSNNGTSCSSRFLLYAYWFVGRYPFFLPNLFGALVCAAAAAFLMACVPETLPAEKRRNFAADLRRLVLSPQRAGKRILCCWKEKQQEEEAAPLLPGTVAELRSPPASSSDATANIVTVISNSKISQGGYYGTHQQPALQDNNDDDEEEEEEKQPSLQDNDDEEEEKQPSSALQSTTTASKKKKNIIWDDALTRKHMVVNWSYSFVTTMMDEAFPLFCMSAGGGLNLAEAEIGKVLSGAGLVFSVSQYAAFRALTNHFGLYQSMAIGCVLGTVPAALVPVSLLLDKRRGAVAAAAIFLCLVLGLIKVMNSLLFTSLAVAINRTVDRSQRARMNAVVLVGNSIGKFVAPVLAGNAVAFSYSNTLFAARFGSFLVWAIAIPVGGMLVLARVRDLQSAVGASASCAAPDGAGR